VIELATAKTAQGHGRTLAERSGVQGALAQGEAEWRAAHAFYKATLADCWQAAQENNVEPEMTAALRLASTHAVRTCAEAVRRAHDIAGGTSVYKRSAIQRRLRDAQTMTQHMITNATTYEMTGRVLLGGYHPGMQL
jgi:alkylation response protein AidB-like acyl-CoA dehydrogenase